MTGQGWKTSLVSFWVLPIIFMESLHGFVILPGITGAILKCKFKE